MQNDTKKFYWIKLKTDFFNREDIDFMLSQPNGCQYVVLYQMLCLNTANTSGELINKIGEMIVPYNIEKIVRDTKYFDFDTVAVALELYKKLGLIYEQEDGNLKITDVERMIGSESASREAIKKREQRLKKKIEGTQEGTNCPIEYRDKSIDIRYKILDNNKKENEKHCYGEFKRVKLTDKEYLKLTEDYGEEFIKKQINLLDEYIESNNNKNKYSNFNLVLRKAIRENWFKEKIKKEEPLPDWYGKDFENEKNEEAEDVERRFLESLEESQKY